MNDRKKLIIKYMKIITGYKKQICYASTNKVYK